jgi:tRNA (cmo5U34)-methyltransferase
MGKVEIFEKERASGYNQFVETWIPNYNYFLDQLPKLLRPAAHKSLLVAGCGTGNEIERFTRDADPWQITGIDPSPEMIAQARLRFADNKNISLVEGLIADLDSNMKYGAATLLLVLHFLADNGEKLQLLKDIAARLESGAPLVMLDITGDKTHITKNLEVLRLVLPDGLDEGQISSRLNRIQQELHYVGEDRLSALLVEAGFEPPLRFFQSTIYMGWLSAKK